MEYRVEITETLQRTISVVADSKEYAMRHIVSMYQHGEIVLSDSDFVDVSIEAEDDLNAFL
jgi:hypothetical protein